MRELVWPQECGIAGRCFTDTAPTVSVANGESTHQSRAGSLKTPMVLTSGGKWTKVSRSGGVWLGEILTSPQVREPKPSNVQ